jgi:predicted AAA+ superfamily ATPase
MNFTIQQLKSQNPWWDHPDFIVKDYHIEVLNRQKIKWRPKILSQFKLNSDNIYTLRGARQIGKTTSLKILIKELLEKKTNPVNIFYYSCNNIDGYQDFINIISIYLDWLAEMNAKGRIYIFIDEVTFVKDWERAIKHFADLGKLRNVFMILTGSNAYDLKYGTERLPGRRGRDIDHDKIFYPLGFPEFVELMDENIMEKFKSKNIAELTSIYQFHQNDLQKLLNKYLLTGGFISAMNDLEGKKKIELNKYSEYLNWTLGDLAKLDRRESVARSIIAEIIKTAASSLGWDTIAKKVAVSHVTVGEYTEILELIFILKTVYQVDLNSGLLELKKHKKIYFTDPFIFWSFFGWVMGWGDYFKESEAMLLNGQFKSRFVESVIFAHLLKREKSFEFGNKIFFHKGKKEIDFLFRQEQKNFLPIEVKYQNNVSDKDFSAIKKLNFKKGLVITKEFIDLKSSFKFVPAELFLLEIDRFAR